MADTAIEWTRGDDGSAGAVWNPTTGCNRVSPGCDHCYALTMAKRLKGMGSAKYQRDGDPRTSGPGFGLTVHEDALGLPLRWRKPRKVFVNSMSDLFHADVPDEYIAEVFAVMAAAHWHTFQVLTKRHSRMRSLLNDPDFRGMVQAESATLAHEGIDVLAANPWETWPTPNVHLGVSCEDQKWADIRIPALLATPAAVRWVSAEPLLGPILLADEWIGADPYRRDEPSLSWLVAGGESGSGARPLDEQWIRSLVEQCRDAEVPIFVKQLGSVWARANGADPKGGKPEHWAADLRVREYPQPAEVTR